MDASTHASGKACRNTSSTSSCALTATGQSRAAGKASAQVRGAALAWCQVTWPGSVDVPWCQLLPAVCWWLWIEGQPAQACGQKEGAVQGAEAPAAAQGGVGVVVGSGQWCSNCPSSVINPKVCLPACLFACLLSVCLPDCLLARCLPACLLEADASLVGCQDRLRSLGLLIASINVEAVA